MKRFGVVSLVVGTALFAGVFEGGSKNLSLTVGSGTGFNSTYTIIGVTGSYFMVNGLAVGVGYRGWFGGTPTMNEIDLPLTYFMPLQREIRPYVGGLYRYTFVSDDYSDYSTYGIRGGLSYSEGNSYMAIGWVQEWYSADNGAESSRGYPEISAGISF